MLKALCIVYDNQAYVSYFPIAIASIATALKSANVKVEIYNQDMHHYNEQHLTEKLNTEHYDIVCLGGVRGYYPYRKILKISNAINTSTNRKYITFIIGGHLSTVDPTYFLLKTKADICVIGEGDETIKDLVLNHLNSLPRCLGIAYRIEDKVIINEKRPLIKDLDSLSMIDYSLFPIEYYRLQRLPRIKSTDFSMSILTGRGCSFKCNFCLRLMPGIRLRSIRAIVDEIKFLKKTYNISYFDFADDLTLASKARGFELCEAFLKEELNVRWRCEGRLNYASKDVLQIMKKAGCVFINYGIESFDNNVLKNMRKALTTDIIEKGIENTLAEGISPGLNFIFGNIGDNLETLEKDVNFLLKYDDCSQLRTIGIVQPFPGCELFNIAIEKGLLKDTEDFYENKHLNSDLITINFTELTNDEFYNALYNANMKLINNYYTKKRHFVEEQGKDIYINHNSNFRGYRHT